MAFNQTYRVLFESQTDNLSRIIGQELTRIDAEAADIRARGGSPAGELTDRVDTFRAAIEQARKETVDLLREDLKATKVQWQKERDRRPDLDLAKIERAKNRVRALSKEEAEELSFRYSSDAEELDHYELNELKARDLDPDVRKALSVAITERHGNEPWISSDPEAMAIANHADNLDSLTGAQVLYQGDMGQAVFDAGDLIDYSGELEIQEAV